MVDKPAATFGLAGEELIPLESDHLRLSKFSSHDDINYKRISGKLQQWVRKIVEEIDRENSSGGLPFELSEQGLKLVDEDRPILSTVQDWAESTEAPLQSEFQRNQLSAPPLLQRDESIDSSSSRFLSPPRSPNSRLTPTTDDMSAISTPATSVTSGGKPGYQRNFAGVGKGIMKGMETATSATASTNLWPPSTIAATTAAGLAGISAGTGIASVAFARKSLSYQKDSAKASRDSADTAKMVFEYNKDKDLAESKTKPPQSKPKRPSNVGNPSSSSSQLNAQNPSIYPSLAEAPPLLTAFFKGNYDSDDDDNNPGHTAEHAGGPVPKKAGKGKEKAIGSATGSSERAFPGGKSSGAPLAIESFTNDLTVESNEENSSGILQAEVPLQRRSSLAKRTLFDYNFTLRKVPQQSAANVSRIETEEVQRTLDEAGSGVYPERDMLQPIEDNVTVAPETNPESLLSTQPKGDQFNKHGIVDSTPEASPYHEETSPTSEAPKEHPTKQATPATGGSGCILYQNNETETDGVGGVAEEASLVLADGEGVMKDPSGLKLQESNIEQPITEEAQGSTDAMNNQEVETRDESDLPFQVDVNDSEEAEPDITPAKHLEGFDAVELITLPPGSQSNLE